MRRTAFILAAAALFSAAIASPALAGPPWISIELPANPLNATTRGMYLLVRSYHHADATAMPVTGTATGMVDGVPPGASPLLGADPLVPRGSADAALAGRHLGAGHQRRW